MTETYLESRMRDGRLIVTFLTDLAPGQIDADPDALHHTHVARARLHAEWLKLDPHYRADPEITAHFADHLPSGRVVGRDGTNYGTGARRETRLRRDLAALEAEQDTLTEHFAGEEWADDELDRLRDVADILSEDLAPYDRAAVRRARRRRDRRYYARSTGRMTRIDTSHDARTRRETLHALDLPVGRGTMSEPMGTARNLRQIAQVAA